LISLRNSFILVTGGLVSLARRHSVVIGCAVPRAGETNGDVDALARLVTAARGVSSLAARSASPSELDVRLMPYMAGDDDEAGRPRSRRWERTASRARVGKVYDSASLALALALGVIGGERITSCPRPEGGGGEAPRTTMSGVVARRTKPGGGERIWETEAARWRRAAMCAGDMGPESLWVPSASKLTTRIARCGDRKRSTEARLGETGSGTGLKASWEMALPSSHTTVTAGFDRSSGSLKRTVPVQRFIWRKNLGGTVQRTIARPDG
jgi:hypothetical protein